MGRKADDTLGIDGTSELGASAKDGLESFSSFVVGNDDDERLTGSAREEREIEGTGSYRESGDTPTAHTKAEVPLYAIECGGVLQLREDFADEREDHVQFQVYQRDCASSERENTEVSGESALAEPQRLPGAVGVPAAIDGKAMAVDKGAFNGICEESYGPGDVVG